MTEYTRFELDDGQAVLVEVEPPAGVSRAGGDVFGQAAATFEQALYGVRAATGLVLRQFRDLPQRPDEVQLTFGVKLDAQAGAVIAKTGMQGHFELTLKWQRCPAEDT